MQSLVASDRNPSYRQRRKSRGRRGQTWRVPDPLCLAWQCPRWAVWLPVYGRPWPLSRPVAALVSVSACFTACSSPSVTNGPSLAHLRCQASPGGWEGDRLLTGRPGTHLALGPRVILRLNQLAGRFLRRVRVACPCGSRGIAGSHEQCHHTRPLCSHRGTGRHWG